MVFWTLISTTLIILQRVTTHLYPWWVDLKINYFWVLVRALNGFHCFVWFSGSLPHTTRKPRICLIPWKNSFGVPTPLKILVVYFDQLSGVARIQKLVEILFKPFSTFFVHLKPFSVISYLKSRKNIWKWTDKSCVVEIIVNNQRKQNLLKNS